MNQSLVIVEHDNKKLKAVTRSVFAAAAQLDQPVDAFVAGFQCEAVVEELRRLPGVANILLFDEACFQHQLAETNTLAIMQVAKNYNAILSAATTAGKNLLPRVAALLDVAQISEITKIISTDTFVRPIYAGNALATVRSNDKIKVITVRASAFPEVISNSEVNQTVNTERMRAVVNNDGVKGGLSCFVSESLSDNSRPDLTSATIVVAGGRGLESADNFQLVERLADKLGAAVGASRAAVDAGYVGNELQVGQTGKIIAPNLYIAVGISGAIQHLAGMKDSKVIVAINKDADAPIFNISDYGLVADLFEALPQLQKLI